MTRARGSEGMSEVEEEEKTSNASKKTSFKDLTGDWDGPDDLASAEVDKIWDTVESWIYGWQSHAGKSTVGGFLNYCQSYCETVEEDYEVELWMLNLVAHHVLLDKSWLETADAAKDWGNALLSEDWKVPPPLWARHREDKWMLEGKDKENTEESLEILPTSPLDPNWGKGLPAPSPVVAAPSTPMWRPWEEDVVIDLSAAVQKRKRRSPAAEARSRLRLLEWQERRYRHRLQSELRTTPIRSIEMTKARLINRLEVHAEGVVHSGVEGDGVVEKTVFASNQTNTIVLPQFLKLPVSSFVSVTSSTSRTSDSGFWMQFGCSNCPDTLGPYIITL